MKLLHIVATPRGADSNTLHISNEFLAALHSEHPDLEVSTLDLFAEDLPSVAGDNIESKYTLMVGQKIDPAHAESWKQIEALIARFMDADVYLISVPMWNYGIPYALKYFIDAIVQPGYLFTFSEQGVPIGLCRNKRMVCISTRGGDYSEGGPMHALDQQEPYLRAIFGFVGITDVEFICAQPMDISPDLRATALGTAVDAARQLAKKIGPMAEATAN